MLDQPWYQLILVNDVEGMDVERIFHEDVSNDYHRDEPITVVSPSMVSKHVVPTIISSSIKEFVDNFDKY